MANPSSIAPYNNPHDTLYTDDILNFLDTQNPTLEDLTTQEIPFSYPSSIPQSREQIDHTLDPLDDPVIRDFCNEPNAENSQRETDLGTESLYNLNSSPLSVWPSEPVAFGCSCCQEAAKKMEFSATVVKKICRKYGVTRWPHRKIQSMEKKITNWASRLTSINDPEERARAENVIQSLHREISRFGEGSS
ncbi:hypothetical protein CRYUN_Cryun19dG0143600 [Craigia yunnanensis]